jgi:multidrug efflux pump subunit AcrA (membrane-fusion protein)
LIIVLLVGSTIVYLKYFRTPPVQYVQQKAAIGNLTVSVSATGPVQPHATYTTNFSTAGEVQSINVHVGQAVKAGQTLAVLNSSTLRDALIAAQHKLSAAQTIYTDDVSAGARQPALDQDQSAITAAQDGVNAAQDALNETTLKAPANSTVAAINGTVGQNVGNGGSNNNSASTTGTGFMTLLDTSSFTIAAQVNEADIAQVKAGQNVNFTVPAYPTKTFAATVADIQTLGQTTSNVVDYTVDLTVNQSSWDGATLYSGMTATANIITTQARGVLLVPNSALTFSAQALQQGELSRTSIKSLLAQARNNAGDAATQGKRGTLIELQNGKLVPVLVRTSLTDGQNTAILSGLNAGDSVVISQVGGSTSSASPLNGVLKNRVGKNGAGLGGRGAKK